MTGEEDLPKHRPQKAARPRFQPESTAVVDASDAQPIRLLAASPRIQPHPPVWTQVDGMDMRLKFVNLEVNLPFTT